MKKILSIVIILSSIFVISGCSKNENDIFGYLFTDEIVGARNCVYTLTDEEKDDISSRITKLEGYLEKDSSYILISVTLSNLMNNLFYINEQYVIIYTYYSMFPSNLEIYSEYLDTVALQSQVFQCYNQSLVALLDSKYRDDLLNGWTEEEIKVLEDRRDLYDDEYYKLEEEATNLQIKFDYSLSNESYEDEIEEIFIDLVGKKNEIAVKLGYDNNLEYAYNDYFNREFSYDELSNFNSIIKNDLIPALSRIGEKIDNYVVTDESLYEKINPYSVYEIYNDKSEMNKLADYLGGDYLENYNYFWKNGEYYFGNTNSKKAAYKFSSISDNVLLAYFGPGYYSNLYVFSHEFGHYAAGIEDMKDDSNDNLELAEFQAQANEYLLSSFMYQNNKNNDTYKLASLEKLYSGLESIFSTTMINEFEYRVYSSNNLTVDYLKSIMEDVLNDYNALDLYNSYTSTSLDNFWQLRAGSNPCYYIAYAISLVPSIEMYFVALDDLESTIDIYDTIMKGQNYLFPVLEDINFSNPIETNILSELIDKVEKML